MQMSVAQFAKKLKISRFTVYNWIKYKTLPKGVAVTQICGRIILEADEDFRNVQKGTA